MQLERFGSHNVPTEIYSPRYNIKCRGGNVILCGIFHVLQYHIFLFISCYIAEIWIAFLTVHGGGWVQLYISNDDGLCPSIALFILLCKLCSMFTLHSTVQRPYNVLYDGRAVFSLLSIYSYCFIKEKYLFLKSFLTVQ